MDINSILERVKANFIPLILAIVGLILVVVGCLSFIPSKKEQTDIIFEPAGHQSAPDFAQNKEADKKITVDVEGGVVKPGVYSLSDGSRMQDAVIAAGGMSEQANTSLVAKTLNLAAKLTDGAKVYIPIQGELQGVSSNTEVAGVGVINLNSASAKELDTLSGIGEVTVQKIISGRPFASVEELLSKKIVSKKVFDQIKEKVSVY